MSDGLLYLTERDLNDLGNGEILTKTTIDGGTTVNVRLLVQQGISHSRVMERARELGFGRGKKQAKPQPAPTKELPLTPPPGGGPTAVVPAAIDSEQAGEPPAPHDVVGEGAPARLPSPDTASTSPGPPPAPAPSTAAAGPLPTPPTGGVVGPVEDDETW